MKKQIGLMVIGSVVLFCLDFTWAQLLGTAFTYQGSLMDAGERVSGIYDFMFELYDDPNSGSQIGGTLTANNVTVSNGLFTEELDFGPGIFSGQARWIEVSVQGPSDPAFTTLPRLEMIAAPNALYSSLAGQLVGGIGIDGTGTSGYIPIFTAPQVLADSIIYQSGSSIGIGTAVPSERLAVSGNAAITGNLSVTGIYYDSSYEAGTAGQILSSTGSGTDWIDATIGDITAVNAGLGLSGGGPTGDVTLDVDFAGSGAADSAARSDHAHDSSYYTQTQLQTGGGANVHWNNLSSVPAGFADGTDDVGGDDSDWTISGSDMYTDTGVTGNVGIGTTSPSEKLEVDGNAKITGNLTVDGSVSWGTGSSHGSQMFTSSGTFTAPPGVTMVFLTMVGGGGGGRQTLGGSGPSGGCGGGGGGSIINWPYPVTPGNNYTIVVGQGGVGGYPGNDGGDTVFDGIVVAEGGKRGGNGGLGPDPDAGLGGNQKNSSWGNNNNPGVGGIEGGNGNIGYTSGDQSATAGGASAFGAGGGIDSDGELYGGGGGGGGSGGDGAGGMCIIMW